LHPCGDISRVLPRKLWDFEKVNLLSLLFFVWIEVFFDVGFEVVNALFEFFDAFAEAAHEFRDLFSAEEYEDYDTDEHDFLESNATKE
jgi:hypothetical protein